MNVSLGMVNPIELSSAAQERGGKVVLPVQRGDSYYAHFKYVLGVPAGQQQNSVPLKRLELINNMIVTLNNLNRMTGENLQPSQAQGEIDDLGMKIQEALKKLPPAFQTAEASSGMAGMIFQVKA